MLASAQATVIYTEKTYIFTQKRELKLFSANNSCISDDRNCLNS